MFDIAACFNSILNSTCSSVKEILYGVLFEYNIVRDQLPGVDGLMGLLERVPGQDEMMITFISGEDMTYVANGEAAWIEAYEQFVYDLFEDYVIVKVEIKKKISNGVLNVYNLHAFQQFLMECSIADHLTNFTELFSTSREHLVFKLLDTNGSLRTKSIAFSDNDIKWSGTERSRIDLIKNCDDASVFLDRTTIKVIPQDFEIQDPVEGYEFQQIVTIFNKLRNILAYVYLANTSSIHKDKAVLHFDPSSIGFEYKLNSLSSNNVVAQIFDWIFKDDSCVDKASIARKIINVYCRSEEEILSLDERIFNSIKSDYQIYQKNHVEQYIDMKNKISDHIVESAKQIQELTHELSDAIRNNFVAIIVFIMTVFLTESIDFSKLLEKSISPRITTVCGVFTTASLLYLIVTIITSNEKWTWLEQSYNDLKENYKRTLDAADIEEAFNHDLQFNHAIDQFKSFKKKVLRLWSIAICVMAVFTVVLFLNGTGVDVPINDQVQIIDTESSIEENESEECLEEQTTEEKSIEDSTENTSELTEDKKNVISTEKTNE